LKLPALTPAPLYIPPLGLPPVSAKGGVFRQVLELPGQLGAGGKSLTVTLTSSVLEQPLSAVTMTE
jgi:hypothetical protein